MRLPLASLLAALTGLSPFGLHCIEPPSFELQSSDFSSTEAEREGRGEASAFGTPLQNQSVTSFVTSSAPSSAPSFEPFTGKVNRNKVRIRLQAQLDGPVLKEANRGELFVIVGESADFYAIEAPPETKAYIFRTYVLDGTVEGSHVNVRLEPSLEGAVIAQLNQGDRVDGKISPLNSKWMEIQAPEQTRFYIAKEFLQKVGDAAYFAQQQNRQREAQKRLEEAESYAKSELQKPFSAIDYEQIAANYSAIFSDYSDFELLAQQAQELLNQAQNAYLALKVDYAKEIANPLQPLPLQISAGGNPALHFYSEEWVRAEQQVFQDWLSQHSEQHPDQHPDQHLQQDREEMAEFYRSQRQQAQSLSGIIQAYDKPVHNKPGDYLLIDRKTKRPLAYLYSTQVDLAQKVGQPLTLMAAPRANNNFAFPAFYVLDVE